jgi:rhodanese-related sulfurtransferase
MKKLIVYIVAFLAPVYLLAGVAEDISQDALLERIKEGADQLILDVRSEKEYQNGHIAGAVHIPFDEIKDRLAEVEPFKSKDIIVYCQSGRRAGMAAKTLKEAGFTRLYHLDGDWGAWSKNDRPFVK